ncbi:hypothetical protein DL96DRAFT_535453 [Flagelloscypha sp. PMI_526]|nr:hypothetical protein DL96DRAFT_535453 [Flagelloscypha sp. PMI_526]
MKGCWPHDLDLDFPQLETISVCISRISFEHRPHIQRFLSRSYRLEKATLGLWHDSRETWNTALVPIQRNGKPIPSIRILEIQGQGVLSSPVLDIHFSSILPQLEHLLIDVQPSPSMAVISQLNARGLRTLKLGQLSEATSFQTFCTAFGGGNSLLEELTIVMGLISASPIDAFPVFPQLTSLILAVADWSTLFLTRLPTCVSALESLSLFATTGIAISTNVVLPVWDIYGVTLFSIWRLAFSFLTAFSQDWNTNLSHERGH